MSRKCIKYLLTVSSMFLFALAAMIGTPKEVKADDESPLVIEIKTEKELWDYAEDSHQGRNFAGHTLRLMNDITITMESYESLEFLNFGISDDPFAGTFDGNGHTITNLKNEKSTLPDHDNGLFAWTKDAVIKDLTLVDPIVSCAYRGGILVGYAENTTIENIRIHGGKLKIQPANNVVSLITNVGFAGGAVAGTLNNSTMYNCEVRGTEVVNNSTQGVAALGGEGLYMGGLVGSASNNSVIEYCRMDDGKREGKMVESTVRNEYDVAVGALGGKAIYAGGIAGEIKGGSQIIDSYSTADVYAYSATYVSVGSGNVSYVGGVVAEVYGEDCKVVRCHYAGNAHSKQYNAILVIPIIQNDTYVSGVAQYSESNEITNSYFKRSACSSSKDLKAINDKADTGACSALTDAQYADRDFWKEKGYDLTGTITRTEGVTIEEHYNKWVMDYERGIPIHGNSVSAAFDFPAAASVTIDGTDLIKNSMEGNLDSADCSVTTDNAHSFAVQGFDTYEKEVQITAETNEVRDAKGNVHADAFKFCGWYLARDNLDDSAPKIKEYYEAITGESGTKVSDSETYKAGTDPYPLEDNDLYVAHYQANVVFHDINGDVINKATGETDGSVNLEDDYYNYQDALPDVKTAVPDGCTFYGWTDVPSGTSGGYNGITSDVLNGLKSGGNIYQPGDLIEKPLKLYPIFTNYVSNVITIMEGNEQDGEEPTNLREHVGTTVVSSEDDGKVYINVIGWDENNEQIDNEAWEERGYRFLGWYEIITDENGTEHEYRISKDMKYELTDVDLSEQHTYKARLEYNVEYWVKSNKSKTPPYVDGALYAEFWQEYDTEFQDLVGPELYLEKVVHWADNGYNSDCSGCSYAWGVNQQGKRIVDSLTVYGHLNPVSGNHSLVIVNDFPGAGTQSYSGTSITISGFKVTADISDSDKYNFILWTREYENNDGEFESQATSTELEWSNYVYKTSWSDKLAYGAHYTANINFHKYNDDSTGDENVKTVTRRYQEHILLDEQSVYEYAYELSGVGTGIYYHTSLVSPGAEFADIGENYHFIGWIDKSRLSQDELAYIYDVDGEPSCTSQVSHALPYIIDKDDIVERAMDLYAVYVKEDIVTTTNIREAGVPEGANILLPTDPKYTLSQNEDDGSFSLSLTAYTDKDKVIDDADSDTLYSLQYVECIKNPGTDSEEVTRLTSSGKSTDGTEVYFDLEDFDLGPSYKFIAYYEPLVVLYHLNDNTTDVATRNEGQRLGASPSPLYNEKDLATDKIYRFVGWTTEEPNIAGHQYYLMSNRDEDIPFVTPMDIVTESLELFPAYAPISISVTTNIEDELNKDSEIAIDTVRYIARNDSGDITVNAVENIKVSDGTDTTSYVFTGWKVKYSGTESEEDFSQDNTAVVDEVFDGATYIAQYKKGYTVNYYYWDENDDGTWGEKLLYSVGVTEGDDRTFLQSYEMTDSDGKTETVEIPYDTEAFINILSELNSDQYFDQWQWVQKTDTDTVVKDWDDFAKQTITSDMDLYPVIWQIRTFDSEDTLLENNKAVYTQATLTGKETGEQKVSVYFDGVYSQSSLRVNVSRQSYEDVDADGNNGTFVGIEGIPVSVYNEYKLIEVPPEDGAGTEMTGTLMGRKETDGAGNAEFTFDGLLTLEKKVTDGVDADEPFLFTVKQVTEQGDGEELQVMVRAGETVTVKLPFGEYIVLEDGTWAWRYTPEYAADTKDPNPSETEDGAGSSESGEGGETTSSDISTMSAGADAGGLGEVDPATVYINSYNSSVTCTNKIENGKWFDDSTDKKNVFGKSLTDSE